MRGWSLGVSRTQVLSAMYVQCQTDLYEGKGNAAWSRIAREFPALRSSVMSVRAHRRDFIALRGRVTLACAAENPRARRRWLALARRDARRLHREGNDYASGLATLLDAGVAIQSADVERALTTLRSAERLFAARDLKLHASVSQLACATIVDDGAAIKLAVEKMDELGVRNPGNMLRLWLPGLPRGASQSCQS